MEKKKEIPIKKRILPSGKIIIEDKSRGMKIITYGKNDIIF